MAHELVDALGNMRLHALYGLHKHCEITDRSHRRVLHDVVEKVP